MSPGERQSKTEVDMCIQTLTFFLMIEKYVNPERQHRVEPISVNE